jgi:hypothetical protein
VRGARPLSELYELLYGIGMSDGALEVQGNSLRLKLTQSVIHKEFFENINQKLYNWGF